MKSKMKKSLFVTWIICVLFVMSAMSVQAAGKTGWVRKGTTYKYKVNNIYVKNEVKKIKKYYYYFDDIGTGYKREELDMNKYNEYIFVYNINSEDKNSKFTLNYLGDDSKIRLTPSVLE